MTDTWNWIPSNNGVIGTTHPIAVGSVQDGTPSDVSDSLGGLPQQLAEKVLSGSPASLPLINRNLGNPFDENHFTNETRNFSSGAYEPFQSIHQAPSQLSNYGLVPADGHGFADQNVLGQDLSTGFGLDQVLGHKPQNLFQNAFTNNSLHSLTQELDRLTTQDFVPFQQQQQFMGDIFPVSQPQNVFNQRVINQVPTTAPSHGFFGGAPHLNGFNMVGGSNAQYIVGSHPQSRRAPHNGRRSQKNGSPVEMANQAPANQTHSRPFNVDDFRQSRAHTSVDLRACGAHIIELAVDQHGSRYIQHRLELASIEEKQAAFNVILPQAVHLMKDVFGNYVIQKLLEFGTRKQQSDLCSVMKGHVVALAIQMYGCRVVQKVVECCEEREQLNIINELEGQVLKCVRDQNGNHVVQKIVERVHPRNLQFIVDAFLAAENIVFDLSVHPYGCRVIQRVLEFCTEEQKAPILEKLHSKVRELTLDQYGNYVVQHILENGSDSNRFRITQEIAADVVFYSQQKFASNVIEKCLLRSLHKHMIIEAVCGADEEARRRNATDTSPLLSMMKDQYANYVVQRMLDEADSKDRKKMLFAIKPHIPILRKFGYGKHIIAKLEKYFVRSGLMNQQNARCEQSGQVQSEYSTQYAIF